MIGGAVTMATIIAMIVVKQSITMMVITQRDHKGDRARTLLIFSSDC
jgi:hypothetical protein